MLSFLKRQDPSFGLVFFRGSTPHRPEEYQFLTKAGISGKLGKPNAAAHWSLDLTHKQWGPATLVAFKNVEMPDEITVRFSAGLTDDDREMLKSAGWAIGITAPATRGEVLRDRKNFLRYMRAVMGDDGLIGVDSSSMLFWPRERLDEELAHDADLDVESLFCIHAVSDDLESEDGPIRWLHTHGLGELGAYDYDILGCHRGLSMQSDMFRALAFASLEGELAPGNEFMIRMPGLPIRAIDAAEFQASASRSDAQQRTHDEAHSKRRAVLCDQMPGFLGRLFRGSKPRPSTTLQADPAGCVILLSNAATELTAQRARLTVKLFSEFLAEFAEFEPIGLAKVGCPTSSGGREHPWFSVQDVGADRISGQLENDPVDIPSMERGGRYDLPVEDLTDWIVMLPGGTITPRSMTMARMIRKRPEEYRLMVAQAKAMGG